MDMFQEKGMDQNWKLLTSFCCCLGLDNGQTLEPSSFADYYYLSQGPLGDGNGSNQGGRLYRNSDFSCLLNILTAAWHIYTFDSHASFLLKFI